MTASRGSAAPLPPRRPLWMVVLGALMLGAAFQLLLDGMSKMSTTPSELAGSLLGGAASDPANARQAALFEGLAKTLNGLDPRAWRIYGLAKIALAGLLLYTVAAIWTNDRRGQKAAVAAAWAGIAYQVGSAAFLIGYVRPGVLAVAPAWVDALVAAEPEGPPAEQWLEAAGLLLLALPLGLALLGIGFSVLLLVFFKGPKGRAFYGAGAASPG